MGEKIVETKKCKQCESDFSITDGDREFYDKISPKFNGEVFQIPNPTFCPSCRHQRRLSFRNERCLYKRKCDATGRYIISVYSPEKPDVVYNQDIWWSDKWESTDWGVSFDFDRSAFEQFLKLSQEVPKRALLKGTGSENSDYVNGVGSSKNCYLLFESGNMQDSLYGYRGVCCNDCIDFTRVSHSKNCYEIVDCINCYTLFFSQECIDCRDSSYLYNCTGCLDCFGCINISNKQYYIFNKHYSKAEYLIKMNSLKDEGFTYSDFVKIASSFPRKSNIHINSENVLGDNVYNSKNIINSFDVLDSNNIYHSQSINKNCSSFFDVYIGFNNSQDIYETNVVNRYCNDLIFCNDIWDYSSNLMYCNECKTCKNCFLSTCLTGKEYCIFNKQYTKEEYNKIIPQLIKHMQDDGEWGEFFPADMSPFGYNETVASEHFPLSKKEALGQGFNWSDYEAPKPNVEKFIPASKLPNSIKDIPDDILNWAIKCEETQKPFRIIKQELDFYRKHNLPVPRRHPDQRHLDRMELRNPRKLYLRNCDKCEKQMQSTYAPERKEIVYCEECYDKEL